MESAEALLLVKEQVKKLYDEKKRIHVNVSFTRPRINIQNAEVVISGVYPHIFTLKDENEKIPKTYTVQYVDLLTGQVEILELSE